MGKQGFGALLTNEQWNRLASAGNRRVFARGAVVVRQGETAETVHLLGEGNVKINVARADGADSLIGLRGPGEPLGELSAYSGLPRTATASATGGPCLTHVLTGGRFRHLVAEMGLERLLWQHVVRRQQENEALKADLIAMAPRRRLAEVLLRLSAPGAAAGAPARVLPVMQRELVGAVGRSRSWVQEEFKRLRDAGVISTGRELVVIHDADGLLRLACDEGPQ